MLMKELLDRSISFDYAGGHRIGKVVELCLNRPILTSDPNPYIRVFDLAKNAYRTFTLAKITNIKVVSA